MIELTGLRKEYRRFRRPPVVASGCTSPSCGPRRSAWKRCSSLFAVLAQAVLSAALLPSAYLHGTTAGADSDWFVSVLGVLLRGTGLVAIAAAVGFSVASIGRNTAAALGIGFAYFLVIENVVGSFLEGFRRWLVLGNAIVLVSGEDGGGEVIGRSVVVAALYLTAVGIALLAVATLVFRRRDVA